MRQSVLRGKASGEGLTKDTLWVHTEYALVYGERNSDFESFEHQFVLSRNEQRDDASTKFVTVKLKGLLNKFAR